jgi:hypothetical protein
MNWPGKSSVFFVTVFALVLTGLFAGAARAAAPGDRSGEEFAFFYPSFPTEGGPYVVAASFWDASSSDTTYTGEADSLFVVFNEPVDDTSIDLADFEFTGFEATDYVRTDAVTGRMVVLSGITNMTVGSDSVRVVWNSLGGTDAYLAKDITPVPVTSGPILLEAVLDNAWDSGTLAELAPNDQTLVLTFDHPVAVVDATNIFRTTPELSAAGVTLLKATQGRYVTVTRTAGNLRMMYPGVSKVWLTENDIRWSAWVAGTGQNLMAQKVETDNGGPVLIASYYNDKDTGDPADDEVWLTFTEPIEPASLDAPVNQYDLSGGWGAGSFGNDATQRLQPQSADYANCIVVQNPSSVAVPSDGDEIRVAGPFPLRDYQTLPGDQRAARTTRGVGITRAAYFDRGTDTATDDELHLWFSQALNLGNVNYLDFELYPEITDFWSQITFTMENDALGHVVVSGIQNVTALAGARLPNGELVKIVGSGSVDGLETPLQGCDGVSLIPIYDDSQPARLRLTEIPNLTYKRFDNGTGADTAFLAWRETSAVDDADQYFLFFTNQTTPLDDQFIQNWRNNALAVGNLLPVTINSGVTRCAVNIDTFQVTTDNHPIAWGDQVRFMIVPATYWGIMADGDGAAVLKFDTEIVAGPVCPPHDFDDEDDDMIHVIATYDEATETYTHSIFGDIDAAPCGTQIYIFDGPDPFADNELGHGPINPNGSFAPVVLDTTVVDPMDVDPLYVFAWEDGAFSTAVPILNDRVLPVLFLVDGAIANADRFDPPQIYKLADYVNILLMANDQIGDPAAPDTALSDLLDITADFTQLDNRTTLPSSLGSHPVNAVPLVSMGADEVDNDGDWVADDVTIDLDTDGVMDFPEPYFDENGNGVFDPGETFVDKDDDDLCDCVGGLGDDYDLNLDSADPDEHGFYEVRLLASGDADRYNDVVKGFQLLDPVTDPNGQTSFGDMHDLPVLFDVHDTYLDQTTQYDEASAPFTCEVDEVPPTVAKVNELYSLGTFTEASVATDNLILPTDPTYYLARYFNFTMETPSDDDVLFAVTQIRKSGGVWENLLLDPSGSNGVADFDDDRDGVEKAGGGGQDVNGIDDDEDGVIDNEGEGTDLLDAEVVDAAQDSTADANAAGGDGIYILTDWTDNDNDAFFIFEPYFDPDGGTGSSAVLQKVVWFNVDERTDNDIDDDFDGFVDDASGHGPAEVETYTASADDNEDGIVDGQAVAVMLSAGRVFAVADSAYTGDIYVAAPQVEGAQPGDSDNDIRELTEFVTPAYDVIDPNGILADGALPGLPWGDDAAFNEFTWFDAHANTNVDFWHIAQLAFDEIPDGTQEYQLRSVAYDQAGNANANYSVPITFTVDVSAPELALTECPTGGYPADFVDVSATMPGMQVYDTGIYTLTTQDDLDAVSATFQYRYSYDEGATWTPDWTTLATDVSRPFTTEWTPPTIPLTPPDATVLVELRAFGEDEFGNVQDPDSACVAQLEVIDGMAPWTWFTMIHETENTGHMNVGDMPSPYYYRDTIGPLHVPRGPAIDIWALFSPGEGLASTYDHDVIRVVFEMSLAGSGVWTPFATVTGHVDPDDHTIDLTIPVAVTLETEALETGTYDIRVFSCDLEGNNCTPADEAPTVQYDIAKITVVEEGLRAYIQPVHRLDCELDQHEPGMYDLFAINWIHDYDLDHVLFQYYTDADGDGIDNDGNSWFDIATDDDVSADPRGDVVLHRGMAMLDTLSGWVAFRCDSATYHDSLEVFIDYDRDGYSEKDPIILDVDGDYVFDWDDGDDEVIVGDFGEIVSKGEFALTCFAEDEFHTGVGFYDPTEWIYRDNHASGQPTGTLNNWAVTWDATGLGEGDYLVRAVATDVMFAVDDTVSSPSVIPVESVRVDPDAPAAVIATVTTPDATEQTALNDLYFDATIKWVKICATTDATDIDHIKIQFRIPGHATFGDWLDLDLNDDEDFYADIDGTPGLTAEDEIFLDTGTVPYVWDAGDLPLYLGANGVLDAETMTTPPALIPHMAYFVEAAPADVDTLLEEDGVGNPDDDNDGMDNEDQFGANDWYGPYCIYFPVPNLGLISDTNIEFRAVATDQACNEDPNPAVTRFMFGETDAPETDVVWAKLGDGSEFDVLPLISDGSDVTELGADEIADPVTMLVTSEDETAITQVDLKYRKVGECYGLDEWNNPWHSMSADGFTVPPAPDQNYDYLFTVDLGALEADQGYGVYEFYPEAQDNEGNLTPPPVNPYRFKIMTNSALLGPLADDEAAPGDELWFDATLAVPADDAMITFLYAERVLDEAIDATRITPDPDHATFQTTSLAHGMVGPSAAILTLNGTAGTYYADAAGLIASGQPGDWTYDAGASAIEFAVRPDPTDVILVSYNISGWSTISTDDDAPYTGAWDQPSGGVPTPYDDDTDAYDVIAVLTLGSGECALTESAASEGMLVHLVDESAPRMWLYGLGLCNADPLTYWPGNPSFDTVAGLTEWKLSGIEHEMFVTSEEDVAAIDLVLTGAFTGATETRVPMAQVLTETLPMTFTLYESDFPEVMYGFENVGLQIMGGIYPMTEIQPGVWQVSGVAVPVGTETEYAFAIDQDGNDWDNYIADPRNQKVAGAPPAPYSSVKLPDAGFWYASGFDFGEETAVWKVRAEATDATGNVGVTHDYTFVYDPVAPTIDAVTATSLRFNEDEDVTVNATITDPVPADFDVITVKQVRFQYSPNYMVSDRERYERVWLDFGTCVDNDPTDGWSMTGSIPDPEHDGFDNDGDGIWDEPDEDEATSDMAFRVIAMDDGHNYGTPYELAFILDSSEPAALLTSPIDGAVYPYKDASGNGITIPLAAEITETQGDIAYVLFQYDAGDGWEDVDITPEDGGDHPWDGTEPYAVDFLTTNYLDETDTYVRFRAVAVDGAGNQDGDPIEVLVVVNDITGPTAFPIWARTSGDGCEYMHLTDPHVAVRGHDARIKGTAIDPSGRENLATVTVQYQLGGAGTWTDIAVVPSDAFVTAGYNEFTVGWEAVWDVTLLAEGTYNIRAIAADLDSNADPDPIVATLKVDHTPPAVRYEAISGLYEGFAPYAAYQDDGTTGTSNALTPDPGTGDLTFFVLTTADDVHDIALQWHQEGTDDLGEWNAFGENSAFDYEPNLDFAYNGTTYHVWQLHIDDFVDYCANFGISGVMELRALATDYAGNANILHDADNPWTTWTIDIDDPAGESLTNNLTDNQVESGQPVHLNAVMTDATTDVDVVRFEYSEDGITWTVMDPDPATEEIEAVLITGENIDTEHSRWLAEIDWTTPYPLTHDTEYQVRAVFYDTAGNQGTYNGDTVTVEDNIKPDLTKVWAIPAVVSEASGRSDQYEGECYPRPGVFIDKNGNQHYNCLVDVALDLGAMADSSGIDPVLVDGVCQTGTVGDAMATWPRYVDEVVLGGELIPMLARTVTLVGRTQIDDDGLMKVEFWAVNAAGDRILIATDECPPAYTQNQYFWHIYWNTLETDEHGDPKYPDGTYTLVPIAYDTEGNVEDWPAVLSAEAATVVVDNTAPTGIADANAATEEIETAITIERNDVFQMFARTETETEDDILTFYTKRAADLNMDPSWTVVPEVEGLDASDQNPDETRPYVFDWDLDKMDEPFPLEDPVVGVPYHFVAPASDILNNAETPREAFAADHYVTFTVVDTRAPVATITKIQRVTGNTTEIELPHLQSPIYARDLAYMKAKILGLDNDTERVEFMYALSGQAQPTLIDGDVVRDPSEPYTWRISGWDLSPLAGQTLEVFAVGTDDVGNTDFSPATGRPIAGPVFTLVVDYTAPEVTVVRPVDGMKECRDDVDNEIYQLLFSTLDVDIDPETISWCYKLSRHTPEENNWLTISTDILFDAGTGVYAGNWDLRLDTFTMVASDLYDVRLRVTDYAGNELEVIAAQNVVIDTTDPWGEMTRVVLNGVDYYPTMNIDISSGDVIGLWATGHDLTDPEQGKPLHTGISQVIFQAGTCVGDDTTRVWRDLGFWQPPTGTIYEEVTATIDWNSSGMGEGNYDVRAVFVDDECNTYETATIALRISDIEPPRARIAAIQPWRIPHGDDPTTFADIYGYSYSDETIAEVQFQYSTDGETWIPFGLAQDPTSGDAHDPELCNLWYSQIDLRTFSLGQNVWLRAVATDEMGNQDEAAPILATTLVRLEDGTLNLVPGDLGAVQNPVFEMMGYTEPEELIVSVTMPDADQVPLVMWTWPMPEHEGGGAECLEMTRMIDNPRVWRGDLHLPETDCGAITIYANALQDGQIDLHSTTAWSYEVDRDLGTNGTVMAAGYPSADDEGYLYATGNFPAASGGIQGCFMIAPSTPPTTSADQARFMTILDQTCYFMAMIEDYEEHDINPNYWPTMSIEYDDSALLAACGGDVEKAAEMEQYLTVREANWNEWDGEWSGEAITHITVDPVANKVTFMCQEVCYLRPFFALFVPKWDAPVRVRSFTPASPDPNRWNVTDRDPVVVVDLNSIGAESIDCSTIEVWIDGNLVASRNWVQGGGSLDVQSKDGDGTLYQVIYCHSTDREWRLAPGAPHTLNVMYKTNGVDEWVGLPATAPGATFYVDAAPPTVELHSGFAANPALHNADGYILPGAEHMLNVKLYDSGSGVLVEPMRLSDGQDEMGIKYDLWVVDHEDDQWGVDEYEERILLHTGTASEVVPFIAPPVYDSEGTYCLADSSILSIPTVAGGHLIADGDILELVLYTKKHVEEWVDRMSDCDGVVIWQWDGYGEMPADSLAWLYLDCYVDNNLGLHVYEQGILDWTGNVGAEFAEYRFVVDMGGPQAMLVSPANGITDPGEVFCFELSAVDGGSGVNTADVTLADAHGAPVELTNVVLNNGKLTGCTVEALPLGTYSLTVVTTDRVGNTTTTSYTIGAESRTLGVTEAYLGPNPVNPSLETATIFFTLSRASNVTVKVYDFAGDFVSTVVNNQAFEAGTGAVSWAGDAADGSALANGAYMIRVEAFDGAGHQATTVKAVIWRE